MANLNRRQWLRTAGLGGAFSLLGGWQALAASTDASLAPHEAGLPGDGPARLASNENPYGPSPKVREAILKCLDEACRYPFAYTQPLLDKLAQKEGLTPEHIVLTAGSTEGLKTAGLTFGLHGAEIVSSDPTFHVLMEYAEQLGAYIHRVPVNEQLGHDLDAMERRITQQTRLVFVCNPDNPTGTLLPAARMRDFCASLSRRTVVFADEAYFDYVTEPGYPSMIELVKAGMNVIVSRTFSKVYGLAGIRIGYLIARPDLATRLRRHVMANLSMPAVYAALAALDDQEFYRFSLQKNTEAKAAIYQALDAQRLRYVRSHANFVFFYTGRPVQEFNKAMNAQGVLTGRPFPPLLEWCRVSTGASDDMRRFAQALALVQAGK